MIGFVSEIGEPVKNLYVKLSIIYVKIRREVIVRVKKPTSSSVDVSTTEATVKIVPSTQRNPMKVTATVIMANARKTSTGKEQLRTSAKMVKKVMGLDLA